MQLKDDLQEKDIQKIFSPIIKILNYKMFTMFEGAKLKIKMHSCKKIKRVKVRKRKTKSHKKKHHPFVGQF